MKHIAIIVLLTCCSFAFTKAADSIYNDYAKLPALKQEELQKVLFSTSAPSLESSPPYFNFRLYNGVPDKTIIGIVITVTGKKSGASPQEIFIPVTLPPLEVFEGNGRFFADYSEKSGDIHFNLKEVRYKPIKG